MVISSETLAPEELAEISGCKRQSDQVDWLTKNGWTFHKNRGGDPIVGRLYARLKLAGINPQTLTTAGGWAPDFSQVR
jgi:hypothetical protein